MDELKPCPFCGGKAKWRYSKPCGWIQCKKCGATSVPVADSYEEADGKEVAIAAWNRRVNYGWLVPQMCTADDLKTDLPLPRTYSTKGSDSDA